MRFGHLVDSVQFMRLGFAEQLSECRDLFRGLEERQTLRIPEPHEKVLTRDLYPYDNKSQCSRFFERVKRENKKRRREWRREWRKKWRERSEKLWLKNHPPWKYENERESDMRSTAQVAFGNEIQMTVSEIEALGRARRLDYQNATSS